MRFHFNSKINSLIFTLRCEESSCSTSKGRCLNDAAVATLPDDNTTDTKKEIRDNADEDILTSHSQDGGDDASTGSSNSINTYEADVDDSDDEDVSEKVYFNSMKDKDSDLMASNGNKF